MPINAALTTDISEDRDFVEWHRGCPWSAVWVLRTEHAPVVDRVAQARACLAPWLPPRYARQPHVTLAYRGLMAEGGMYPHAVFDAQALRADVQALQSACLAPFALQLQGADSFSSVPYLAVAPSAALLGVHEALTAHAPAFLYPGWRYVPHVTLGHYSQRLPLATVLEALQACVPARVWWQCRVQQLWLARYRTDDIAGALSFEGYFDCTTHRYHAVPGALLVL